MKKKIIISIVLILLLLIPIIANAKSQQYVFMRKEKLDENDKIKVVVSVKNVEQPIIGMQGTIEYNRKNLILLKLML